MKYLCILLLILACKTESQKSSEDTVYFLIRHAEKDRSDKTNPNPDLSTQGIERAEEWVTILKDKGITQIYSTDYNRTQQTASPLAEALKLDVLSYDPRNLYAEDFQKKTKGHTVLVVGHSNTTPAFVNKILGEDKFTDLDDNNNGALFKVTVKLNGKTEVKLTEHEDGFK